MASAGGRALTRAGVGILYVGTCGDTDRDGLSEGLLSIGGYAIILYCEKERKHDRVEVFMLHRSDDTVIPPGSSYYKATRSSRCIPHSVASEIAMNYPACSAGV